MKKTKPEIISKIIGSYIAERRESLQWTKEELKVKSGVSVKQIRKIENYGDGKFIHIIKIYQAMDLGHMLKPLIGEGDDGKAIDKKNKKLK